MWNKLVKNPQKICFNALSINILKHDPKIVSKIYEQTKNIWTEQNKFFYHRVILTDQLVVSGLSPGRITTVIRTVDR